MRQHFMEPEPGCQSGGIRQYEIHLEIKVVDVCADTSCR